MTPGGARTVPARATPSGAPAPFALRGAVEGFYGTFYTFPERNDLIRFLGRNGFNFYLYGPKNDRQHRMRWWDPYPPRVLDDFEETIRIAREHGVEFCYAISFGVPMNYASDEDFAVVTRKLRSLYDRGCRSFGVLFDDLAVGFTHQGNRRRFRTVAEAHASVCNRLLDWARLLDGGCSLYMCPPEYHGRPPFSDYLHDLGRGLDPAIQVFYTGPDICSSEIAERDVAAFAEAVRRQPLLWDNYPANDLDMRSELHIGPLRGRDPLLYRACGGVVANLMNQAEASRIALVTLAEYLEHPHQYDPEGAWERALRSVGGEDSYEPLRRFAENSLGSALSEDDAPMMTGLASQVLARVRAGACVSKDGSVAALSSYLDTLDESCYHLKNRMRNIALRQNILPWIEALEDRIWMGRRALSSLIAMETGADHRRALQSMEGLLMEIERHPRRIGGEGLLRLAEYVRDCDGAAAQAPALPPTPRGAPRGSPMGYPAPVIAAAMDSGAEETGGSGVSFAFHERSGMEVAGDGDMGRTLRDIA